MQRGKKAAVVSLQISWVCFIKKGKTWVVLRPRLAITTHWLSLLITSLIYSTATKKKLKYACSSIACSSFKKIQFTEYNLLKLKKRTKTFIIVPTPCCLYISSTCTESDIFSDHNEVYDQPVTMKMLMIIILISSSKNYWLKLKLSTKS